ncbi:MAG: hypothetical protein DRG78_21940 [Epsilonproteobacteria bacterium]|nr:MAG: hypothetical protein DRG78_21940 [Campylobacterota bacterium]
MSWLFRKRIKWLPGIFLNLSRSGLGLGLGTRGASVSVGKRGIYANTGFPGTGIYRRDKLAGWSDFQTKKNKKTNTTTTISKQRQSNPKIQKKETYLSLMQGDKKRVIINNVTFGRAECKGSFKSCDEIYVKQFSFVKDNNNDWFMQGITVPKSAKSRDGKIYNFYPTFYNGVDITNKVAKLQTKGEISVGNTKFRITISNT